jgi:hypothetical protein
MFFTNITMKVTTVGGSVEGADICYSVSHPSCADSANIPDRRNDCESTCVHCILSSPAAITNRESLMEKCSYQLHPPDMRAATRKADISYGVSLSSWKEQRI